jgi:hypothetical protein
LDGGLRHSEFDGSQGPSYWEVVKGIFSNCLLVVGLTSVFVTAIGQDARPHRELKSAALSGCSAGALFRRTQCSLGCRTPTQGEDVSGTIYRKGTRLFVRVRFFGKQRSMSTPYGPGQEREAESSHENSRERFSRRKPQRLCVEAATTPG